MALKVGLRGLWFEVGISLEDYGRLRLTAAADCGPSLVPGGGSQDVNLLGGNIQFFCFPWAINNQFRTVSDKRNPTV